MSKLHGLSRDDLIEIIEGMEALAEEAVSLKGYVDPNHGEGCHTRHAGCLAESILEVSEDKLMEKAVARIVSQLIADRKNTCE